MNTSKYSVMLQYRRISKYKREGQAIIIMDKNMNQTIIIDVAIPVDVNIRNKEWEKITKYKDLAFESDIRKNWNVTTKVIPIVFCAFGTVTGRHEQYLEEICVTTRVELILKPTLLGTEKITGQVFDI